MSSHAVVTGPITGTVTLSDGRVVDVTPEVVYVEDQATAVAVAHAIGLHHAAHGHPTDPHFTYNNQE